MGLSNLPKGYIKGGWVTTANIGNTGTGVVASASMAMLVPANAIKVLVETTFTLTLVSGTGSANALTLLQYTDTRHGTADFPGETAGMYSKFVLTATSGNKRIINETAPVMAESNSNTESGYLITRLRGRGTAADSAWTATNIQTRLVYLPI